MGCRAEMDPGCLSRILDQIYSIPDPHQRIKIFYLKNSFLSSRKYDPGCSSPIRILIFYTSRISDPGVKIHWIPDPQHCLRGTYKSFRQLEHQVYLYILVNFHAPGSGSAFHLLILIQDSQMICGSRRIRIRIHNIRK
jgi:hypothetical protein